MFRKKLSTAGYVWWFRRYTLPIVVQRRVILQVSRQDRFSKRSKDRARFFIRLNRDVNRIKKSHYYRNLIF